MKYSIKDYARALAEVSVGEHTESQKEAIRRNFLALIERTGAATRVGKIIEEAGRILRAKEGLRKVTLETARPLSTPRTMLKGWLKETDIVEEKINTSLIAGIRVNVDDEHQLDASFNRKLHKMFSQ